MYSGNWGGYPSLAVERAALVEQRGVESHDLRVLDPAGLEHPQLDQVRTIEWIGPGEMIDERQGSRALREDVLRPARMSGVVPDRYRGAIDDRGHGLEVVVDGHRELAGGTGHVFALERAILDGFGNETAGRHNDRLIRSGDNRSVQGGGGEQQVFVHTDRIEHPAGRVIMTGENGRSVGEAYRDHLRRNGEHVAEMVGLLDHVR